MATRGRKPKPTALKVLEGNPGKRPLNKNEPNLKRKRPDALHGWSPRQKENGGECRNSLKHWAYSHR